MLKALKSLFVIASLSAMAFVAWVFLSPESPTDDAIPIAVEEKPVVIRTNGGWLELVTIRHKRIFKAKDITPTLVGIEIPLCQSTRQVELVAYFTYRTKLASNWEIEKYNGKWHVIAPPIAPSLPVAIDTKTFRNIREDCLWADGQVQEDELKQAISAKLEKQARDEFYVNKAHDEGRKTVSEFVRKWLLSQEEYRAFADLPIDVQFEGEPVRSR